MRKFLYLMFLNIGLLCLCSSIYAQEIVVKGRITGANNEPLAGVTVAVKGTNKSVTTDAGGNFSIRADRGNVLVFTSVGFQKKEVTVTGETINTQLSTDTKGMEN